MGHTCFIQDCGLKCHGPQTQQWLLKWLQWQQKLAFWFTTCRHRVSHSKAASRVDESRAPQIKKKRKKYLTRELQLELRQDWWERGKEQERTKKETQIELSQANWKAAERVFLNPVIKLTASGTDAFNGLTIGSGLSDEEADTCLSLSLSLTQTGTYMVKCNSTSMYSRNTLAL